MYAISVIIVDENDKKNSHKRDIALTALRKAILASYAIMTKSVAKTGEGKNAMNI